MTVDPFRQEMIDLLVRHEGMRLNVYADAAGKLTIGVGRNLTDVGISRAEAIVLLNNDLDAVIADLSTFPWFSSLDPVRQRACADLRFNVGAGGLRTFVRFLADMAAGHYAAAAQELRSSRWDGQVGARAAELAAMIETGSPA